MEMFDAFLPRSTSHYINNNSVIKCYSLFVTPNATRPITWTCTMCAVLFIYYIVLLCYFCAQNTFVSAYGEFSHTCARAYMACMHVRLCLCVIECGNQARIDHDHYCLYKAIVALWLVISLLNSSVFNVLAIEYVMCVCVNF